VISIGYQAFYSCDNLTNITVNSNNSNYSSQDGVLFDKSKTTLIQYPTGNTRTSYTIPNSVISIGRYAFHCCTRLTSVTIPNSVTSIGYWAFNGCTNLTSVTIPDSVTFIDNFAFNGCTSLKDVYYLGKRAEWNGIKIGDINDCLTNATLHCADDVKPQPTPNPTPQPTPQPTTPQSTAPTPQQTTQAQSNPVQKPKSTKIKKVKGSKKAIAVEWVKTKGVKGYEFQVATDKKFKKNKKTVTIKKQKTTKTTVKKLKAKKKYYVRVRTYKIVKSKKVYSSWSKVKSVKTK